MPRETQLWVTTHARPLADALAARGGKVIEPRGGSSSTSAISVERRGIIRAMPTAPDLLTASNIAKELKVSDAKVKKAIAALGLAPAAKKGVCSYYERKAIPKIKKALA